MKHLEKSIEVNFHNLGLHICVCVCVIPKYTQEKRNVDKLDFIKIKNFHASKDSINKLKTQLTE